MALKPWVVSTNSGGKRRSFATEAEAHKFITKSNAAGISCILQPPGNVLSQKFPAKNEDNSLGRKLLGR